MAGLDVDTSSYPKTVTQPPMNPLQTMGNVINIQRGQTALEQQNLDLINSRFGTMVKDFTALANNPNLNEDMIRKRIETDVKLGIATPEMAGIFISQLPPTQGMSGPQVASTLKGHLETWLNHAMTISEAINAHYGSPQTIDTGNAIQPVSVSPINGIRSTGLPIQKQLPTGTPGFQNGQPTFAGGNPNAVNMPPPAPGVRLPIQQPQMPQAANPAAPNVSAPSAAPQQQPNSIAPAPPPNYAEGLKAYNQDQDLATQKLTAIKPALLALPLMDKIKSGPGTKLWNEGVAGLKAYGVISEGTANDDKTAIYQQVNKYLSQYLKGRGGRSDADLVAAEESSPNPGAQINPALRKLTQTAVAQDRIEAARANSFGNRTDYQNYQKHRSQFPSGMDERAFEVDLMSPDEKQQLSKDLQKMKPDEKNRFMRSLRAYEETQVGTH